MKWQAHGVAFQVHPALVLMGAVALWLGEGETLIAFAPALLLHEAAHLAAAHILGIRVESIELMPFGAAVRMENLWRIRAGSCALPGRYTWIFTHRKHLATMHWQRDGTDSRRHPL